MHERITAWLQTASEKMPEKTSFQRLIELIAVNYGQIDVSRLGPVPNESKWGRAGLTPNEALELTGLINFFFGCIYALGVPEEAQQLRESIQREIARIESGSLLTLPTTDEINVIAKGLKTRRPVHP